MRRLRALAVLIALAFTGGNVHCYCQTIGKAKGKTTTARITGTWRGSEKCNSVSAPVALLNIKFKGPELYLSGIYSLQGTIKANFKDDSIIISKQEVKDDPNFTNIFIEGYLVLAGVPAMLSGKIEVVNNQVKEECFVKYQR
jgi:hypothetical protein